ncbi:MAG: hypothetical protein U0414_05960 [Polyangiaceae bacterium]
MTPIDPALDAEKADVNSTLETKREGCCGGAAPTGTDACCARDAEVKSAGGTGCGCAPKAKSGGGCC